MLVEELDSGSSVPSSERHEDETRPLAFRVGRYSAADGTEQLARQEADTLALVEANNYEDGGWFGVGDESGNVETRRRQGKDEMPPTLTWALEQIERAKASQPSRPMVLVAYKEARLFRDVGQKEEVRRRLAKWRDVKWQTLEGVRVGVLL